MSIAEKVADFTERVTSTQAFKNVFYDPPDGTTHLTLPDTVFDFMIENWQDIHELGARPIAEQTEFIQGAAAHYTRVVVKSLIAANQYLDTDQTLERELEHLVSASLCRIIRLCASPRVDFQSVERTVRLHQRHLRNVLGKYEELTMFPREHPYVRPVPCGEYSAELQIRILQLDLSRMREPVLDIGCGSNGNLVRYLRDQGLDATGLDRNADPTSFLKRSSWLDEPYSPNTWGTMISHLAFSNHFLRHHLRKNGNFARYAEKYVEIIHALQVRGTFFYVPDLPFIESYLSQDEFNLIHHEVRQIGRTQGDDKREPLSAIRVSRITRLH
jgi:hypothetical protein